MDWTLEVVTVPVADVDRAKRFYAEQVGFAIDYDSRFANGMRSVQLTPPGSGCSIVIGERLTQTPPGALDRLQVVVADLDAARTQLLDAGVEVSAIGHYEDGELRDGRGGRWNSFAFFSDPDGNRWALQERA